MSEEGQTIARSGPNWNLMRRMAESKGVELPPVYQETTVEPQFELHTRPPTPEEIENLVKGKPLPETGTRKGPVNETRGEKE